EEVVKEKRKLLGFFCTAVQVIGWILVVGGVFWFVHLVAGPKGKLTEGTEDIEQLLTMISWFAFDFVFIGLTAVILAQLARYALGKENKARLLLRCGDKILYFFAFLGVLWAYFRIRLSIEMIEDSYFEFLYLQPLILPTIAKALILVGLGQILKRIIPVIEEYKSLV
ncbi:MAG: hypothetical protein ACYSUK_07460, partial [Planctomycetota bacterium]